MEISIRVNGRDNSDGADALNLALIIAKTPANTYAKTPKVFISNTINKIKLPLLKITYYIITILISLYLTQYKIIILWLVLLILDTNVKVLILMLQ